MENNDGKTPWHLLSEHRIHDEGEARDLIWLLLEHSAAANRRDRRNQMLLLREMGQKWFKVTWILLRYCNEHGAEADESNRTRLLLEMGRDWSELARILMEPAWAKDV
ncbi:hypothetical protein EDB87DRAFT_1577957 [Lactarius vividus]|nr:hypothetical protein EDB87DRAFT_1577957 [Lactarius vividus]